jgi:hypothetical protein
MPREPKNTEDGSGTVEAKKLPDCEPVMLLPEARSVGVQVPLGQKKSWIFWGVALNIAPVLPVIVPLRGSVKLPE